MGRYSKRASQLAKARGMRGQKKVLPVGPLTPTPATQSALADDPLQPHQTDDPDGVIPSSQSPLLAATNQNADEDTIDSELSLEESSCDEFSSESEPGLDVRDNDIVEADTIVNSSRSAYSTLQWKENAGSTLKRSYGSGSKATEKRRRKNQRDLSLASSGTLNIMELFNRQHELQGSESRSEQGLAAVRPRNDQDHRQGEQESLRQRALKDLEVLLNLKREQIKKYGHMLDHGGDLYRRHCMVRNFMYLQNERRKSGRIQSRQEMAEVVAITFNCRKHTGRKIITWEKQWIDNGKIPESKAGKHKGRLSWLEDEGILCGVRDFAKSQGEGQILYEPTIQIIQYS